MSEKQMFDVEGRPDALIKPCPPLDESTEDNQLLKETDADYSVDETNAKEVK